MKGLLGLLVSQSIIETRDVKTNCVLVFSDTPNTIQQDIHPDIRPAGNSPAEYLVGTYFYLSSIGHGGTRTFSIFMALLAL